MVRAWLVDLDGTLYRALPVKVAMAVELALVAPGSARTIARFRAMHEQVRGHREQGDAQVASAFERQLHQAAEAMGMDVERLRSIVEEWMIERPSKWLARFRREPLIAELRQFRATGGKAALVSDYPARRKLAAMGVEDLFDCVVANGEPGGPCAMKPDPAGYLQAARTLGVAVSECLVVGDRDDADGEAARQAGMAFRRI